MTLPLTIRLGSAVTRAREQGKTIKVIHCGPFDLGELVENGYLQSTNQPNVYKFDGHQVHLTRTLGTWIVMGVGEDEPETIRV
jgi:hypothetical protein